MKGNGKLTVTRVVLALFFLFAAILPLITLFANLANPEARAVFGTEQFVTACLNSVAVALTSTVIAIALAIAMAWVLCRTNIRFKGALGVLMTLPMLIPSLAHGMGLVFLFGSNGIITNLFGLDGSIYGFWGIVMGSVLYSFPSAFLIVYDVLKYEDALPYEAADILGIPKLSQFVNITLPYLRKPLISAVFATFTLVVTDYGVPLMVGGKCTTLPVLMYQEVIGLMNFDTGVAIGFVLLIPAVVAFLVDMLNADKGKLSFVSKGFDIAKNRLRDALGYAMSLGMSLFILLPLCSFAIVSFVAKYPIDMTFTLENIGRAFNLNAGDYWVNSVLIAFAVAAIGTVLAYFAGYITARIKGRTGRILHLVAITTLAIPGIVLGLSYVLFFKGTFIYGTFAILILANLIHFFASPYLMAYNSLGKANENLEAVGSTMGISRASILKDVLIPQTADTIIEMFSYFFVNCMVTISAVAFLATTLDMPLALLITDLDAQRLTECTAFVSLMILGTNVALKLVMTGVKKAVRARA
ncbi:ABC transporter permease subunit [Raoultibacter phocaeensis]|uniref:ABC transporter permease subunit n=1 Tax=Raoultibacter phocaeensis TaxID=2479841 RepID=UPI001117CBFF|nr:ABC transporter permease subunit [Raoultibacter phocaeensis]